MKTSTLRFTCGVTSWDVCRVVITLQILVAALWFAIPLGAVDESVPSSKVRSQFVYVASTLDDESAVISWFHVRKDGTLESMPGARYTLPESAALAADPSGRFLFALTKGAVVTFLVNPGTGNLTADSALILSRDTVKTGIVVDPVAPLLFVVDSPTPSPDEAIPIFGPPQVTTYRISRTGHLSFVWRTQIPRMAGGGDPSIDRRGKLLALNTIDSNDSFTTTALSVDSSTGQVTWLNTLYEPFEGYPQQLLVSPTGTHLYQSMPHVIYGNGGANVMVYSVDDTSGVLARVQVQTCGCDPNPAFGQVSTGYSLAMDPSGRFLFQMTDLGPVVYSIDQATGLLTPLPSIFPILPTRAAGAVDATGRFIYFAGTELTGLKVSSTGTLQLIPGTPVSLPPAVNYTAVVLSIR